MPHCPSDPSELGGANRTLAYYDNPRREIVPLLPACYTKVLEIGCAAGAFRANLHPDCEYWGVEPLNRIAEIAATRMDKVLLGTYEQVAAQLPDGYFDLVICNDVIEHMLDPDAFLASIGQKLQPQAYVVGSIPNVRYIWQLVELVVHRDWRYREEGILDYTHLRFFTERSLRRSLREHGFEIEQFQGLNSVLQQKNSPLGRLKQLVYLPCLVLLGIDSQFLQWGWRIRYPRA